MVIYYNVLNLKYTVMYNSILFKTQNPKPSYFPSPKEAQSHSNYFKRKQRKPGAEVQKELLQNRRSPKP